MKYMTEKEIREIIRDELQNFMKSDKFVFEKPIQILDGRYIQTGRTIGTKIGTASDQKLGFYGATPVVRQAAVADVSGGATVDAEARTALNSLLAKLRTLGLIST